MSTRTAMTDRVSAPTQGLVPRLLIRYGGGLIAVLAILLIPAGTWAFWPAWIYCAVLFVPMLFVLVHFYKTDPGLLERRVQYGEKRATQRRVVVLGNLAFWVGFLMPGLDFRFGWSHAPVWLIVIANLGVLAGYGLFARVMKENSYASRTVGVEPGQRLISTGPYAVVRHPMYSAFLAMCLFTPLALGSYWAVIPFLFVFPVIVIRIRDEEAVLDAELPGYVDYKARVRFRLLPGVW